MSFLFVVVVKQIEYSYGKSLEPKQNGLTHWCKWMQSTSVVEILSSFSTSLLNETHHLKTECELA